MDEKLIFSLIERFENSGLVMLRYVDGNQELALKKNGAFPKTAPAASAAGTPPAAQASQAPQAAQNTLPANVIKSPIVATFYAASAPDAPPFVKAGDKVKKGQTLCILEAMKMMNKLEAETDCEIIAIKAKTGDLVEFGQVLFEVK